MYGIIISAACNSSGWCGMPRVAAVHQLQGNKGGTYTTLLLYGATGFRTVRYMGERLGQFYPDSRVYWSLSVDNLLLLEKKEAPQLRGVALPGW